MFRDRYDTPEVAKLKLDPVVHIEYQKNIYEDLRQKASEAGALFPIGNVFYWEDRYTKDTNQFEWYCRYPELKEYFKDAGLDPLHNILVAGCGSSRLSADLYDAGFENITNIDFSETVIAQMEQKYHKSHPNMRWDVGTLLLMNYQDEEFDYVIDKATFDTLVTGELHKRKLKKYVGATPESPLPPPLPLCICHAHPRSSPRAQPSTTRWAHPPTRPHVLRVACALRHDRKLAPTHIRRFHFIKCTRTLISLRYIYGRHRYCTEVQRVLKEDGKFLMVSHGWKEKRIKWLTGHEHR
jgi:SAM-dependent methyltransferase